MADAVRLRQVITNLTMNAVKYSPAGGSITVRCRERGADHIVIEVVDHGLGIPPEQVGKLFQKFERVRTTEHLAMSGTGLGLYICRLIAEGHGGQIWVESELGKGSTFGLSMPRDASKLAQAQVGREPSIALAGDDRLLFSRGRRARGASPRRSPPRRKPPRPRLGARSRSAVDQDE